MENSLLRYGLVSSISLSILLDKGDKNTMRVSTVLFLARSHMRNKQGVVAELLSDSPLYL